MFLIAEWFGGIGAATQAFNNIKQKYKVPFKVFDYVELDKNAVKSYNAINGTDYKPTDINDIDTVNYPELDLLIAGWPCQDYSVAGLGKGLEGTRSSLILLTIDKIRKMKIKPKRILLENVKGLLSKKHSADLEMIKELFDELGYNWNQAVLNSKYFGIPQSRVRVFMFLTRKDIPQITINHLEEIKTVKKTLKDILIMTAPTHKVRIKDMIDLNNKNIVKKDNKLWWKLSDGSLREIFKVKEINKTINIPHTKNFTNNLMGTPDGQMPTIMAGSTRYVYFKNELSQYKNKIIKLDLKNLDNQERDKINKIGVLGTVENEEWKTSNFGAKDRIYGVGGISGTATATDVGRMKIGFKDVSFNQDKSLHGGGGQAPTLTTSGTTFKAKVIYRGTGDNSVIHYRKLLPVETWLLMGFSEDSFNKAKAGGVSDSQLTKQAGNSIVVNVLEAIFIGGRNGARD